MSEDEARNASHEEETDEVEAHSRRAGASEEAPDEARQAENDEVEGHMRRSAPDAEGGRTA
jgi:hypothetical protein